MDNITHGLLGLAIGMVRRRDGSTPGVPNSTPTDKAVVLSTLLAAEIPDIDVFFGRGPLDEFTYHRGLTHSLVAAPFVALLATVITKTVYRKAKIHTLYMWSLLSVLVAHLLNDYMTGWGTRLLLPFSQARLALDWVPIVDLLYTVPLAAAVILAWRKPERRRRAAAAALLYLGVYTFGYRGLSHTLVDRAVAARYAGQPVSQQRVAPNMLNPLAWDFTVDLPDRFEQGRAYPFGAVAATTVVPKAPEDTVVRAVRSAPELQPFFAQFPFTLVNYTRNGSGYVATIGDVRYRMEGRGMAYQVLLDDRLQVTEVRQGGW